MVIRQDPWPYQVFNTGFSSQDSLISKCRKNTESSGNFIVSAKEKKNSLDIKTILRYSF